MRSPVRQIAALIVSALALVALSGPAHAKYKVLYSFCSQANCTDGSGPNYGLVADTHGHLFGTTGGGGAHNGGAIFELAKQNGHWTESVLYSFCSLANCDDGQTPLGPLVIDTSGNLYGVTNDRGGNDFGNVFELVKGRNNTWSLVVLHSFCTVKQPNCADGREFPGGLSYVGRENGTPYDGMSPLYGVTAGGGLTDMGTVYSLTRKRKHGDWDQTVIYNFCASGPPCLDGASPLSQVLVDASSHITGTAGNVFRLVPDGNKWDESVLYNFCSQANCADGQGPGGPLAIDASGNLYGMTAYGGADIARCTDGESCGVIYKIASDGTESTLYRFCTLANCADGTGPEGGLMIDENGALTGVTLGVDGPGTLFRFDGTLHVLHTFCSKADCADGGQPYNVTLIRNAAGDLFGTARTGGANGPFSGGVVFEWTP